MRAFGTALFLVLRRARRDLVALLALILLTALACAIALAVPREIGATLDAAAREAVTAAGRDSDLLLRSSIADASGESTATAERLVAFAAEVPDRLPPELAALRRGVDTGILGPEVEAVGPSGAVVVQLGVLAPSSADAVRTVAGQLPQGTAGGGAVPVVVSSAAAAAAGLGVGGTLSIEGATPETTVTLLISGVIETDDPGDVRWADLPGVWEPTGSGFTALTDAASFDGVAARFPEASTGTVRVSFDPGSFDAATIASAGRAIDALETESWTLTQGAPVSVRAVSGYEEAVEGFPAAISAATAQLSALAAGLLGVAVLVAVLAGTALARRRRPEIALLRSHGASLGVIGAHAAVESIVVTLIGVALGAAWQGWSEPDLLVGVAAIVAMAPVIATLRPLLRPLAPARERTARLGGAATLVAVAVTAVLALRAGGTTGAGVDPLALVAPVLCAAVVALLLAPLPSVVARPLVRAAGRARGPSALLAGAGAQEGRSVLTLVAVVLAASAAVTSLVLLQSVADGQEAQSWWIVGADARIDGAADGSALARELSVPGTEAAAVAELARIGVDGATRSTTATVLAVDSDYGALLAALPHDQPRWAAAEAATRIAAPVALGQPLPALVDERLAASVGTDVFTLEVGGASVPAVATGTPLAGDEGLAVVGRPGLLAALPATPEEQPAAAQFSAVLDPATVLAVGPDLRARTAEAGGTVVLREDVLDAQRDLALVRGAAEATRQSLGATALLAALALLVTTAIGARRRGRTLALLSALGVPARTRYALAAGELTPIVAGGVVGGLVTAAVVLGAAWPAFGVDTLVGGSAVAAAPPWLVPGVLAAAVAALALALAVDAALSRRIRTSDILRSGEES
ncbi:MULTISPECIES: FtsX-like permease family protein [unclassified Rathayibacter]|uniref:FtsX-like permease family protein n=1 Tax=unclassified Rathayibacter TaxID=2609250 RepID=UPI0006FC0072|nr:MULTISPECIES: FtsX-like permease family protein [unclassified Rathayibacter]KQQ03878.1 hypothetical protein ASF42_10485 [Rathayibacter sp. Leaf294]KQS12335.1 hypothetical protein ASG06_10485 [Rathayibacter sp. Leaf185]